MDHRIQGKIKLSLVAALLVAVMALTGCGTSQKVPQPSVSVTPTMEETTSPTPVNTPESTPAQSTPAEEGSVQGQPDDSMLPTIEWANEIKNTITVCYPDSDRQQVYVKNMNMEARFNLSADGKGGIEYLQTVHGEKLLTDTMDLYVRTTDGKVYSTRNGKSRGYMNYYRHGLYYYDMHIFDLEASQVDVKINKKVVKTFDLSREAQNWQPLHSFSDFTFVQGSLTTTITGADPYMGVDGIKVDASKANTVEVTMKTVEGTSGQIFFGTGASPEFSEAKSKHFSIISDGKFHTYSINFQGMDAWTGTITALRLDIDDGSTGNPVALQKVELVSGDTNALPMKLEKIYHIYPDRCYQEFILYFTGDVSIQEAWVEASLKDVTPDETTGAFRTGNNALLDFISADPTVNGTAQMSDGDKTWRLYAPISEHSYGKGDKLSFGNRIFVGGDQDMGTLLKAREEERDPLDQDNFQVEKVNGSFGKFYGYMPLKGYYAVSCDGSDFNKAYYSDPNQYPGVKMTVTNDDMPRSIYIQQFAESSPGSLEAAVLLDGQGNTLPVPVEAYKNFIDGYEDGFYYPDDSPQSESYYPLMLQEGKKLDLQSLHLYQNWGNHPLKQISAIRFFTPYYHLSTGVTETTCYAPMLFLGNSGFLITDYRPMSGIMWSSQPQHDTSDEHRLFHYNDGTGWKHMNYTGTTLESVGPNYSSLTMNFDIRDQAKVKVKSVEMPQTDENRLFTDMEITFDKAVTIDDATTNFRIYSIKSANTNTHYRKVGWLNTDNKPQEAAIDFTNPESQIVELGKEAPFAAIYDIDWEKSMMYNMTNVSILVDRFDAVIGGKPFEGNLAYKVDKTEDGNIVAYLTLKADKLEFIPGDYIRIKGIMMPYGSYKEPNMNSVTNVREQYLLNPVTVEAKTGTATQGMPPVVAVENGKAEFTVKGGYNNVAIKLEGFVNYISPKVYKLTGDQWQEVTLSVEGKDGWQCYRTEDGKYGFVLLASADGSPQTYKVGD